MSYADYLRSSHWRKKRERALERAGGICEVCDRNQATQVHHKTYERLGQERDGDLQAICVPCHRDQHPDKIDLRASLSVDGPCEVCGREVVDMYLGIESAHFVCPGCGHSWAVKRRPKRRKKARRKRKPRQVDCPKCGKTVASVGLRDHWEAKHPALPFGEDGPPTLEELEHERRERERERVRAMQCER